MRFVVWMATGLATCGYLTFIPGRWRWGARGWTGAGLIGTLAGLLTSGWIPARPAAVCAVLAGGALIATAVSDVAEEALGVPDDPRIVIDEWIGYWFAIALLPHQWSYLIAAFVLFRIFDSLKPFGIARAARWPGGWGVVADDLAAGLVANVVLQVVRYLSAR